MPSRKAVGAAGAAGARGATGKLKSKQPATAAAIPKGRKFEEKDLPRWDDAEFKGKLDSLKDIGDVVVTLMAERKALDDEIKAQTAAAREIAEQINSKESWSVRDDGWTGSYVKSSDRETLVRELLIQQGVTLRQIEKATKKTPVKPFFTFRAKGEEG